MEIDKRIEAEIDALLARGESSSVVDALLAIPPSAKVGGADDPWQKLIHARLQTKVSRMMRKTLEGEKEQPGASG